MPDAKDFAVAFLLGCIFFGGMACASAFWGLHCRTVRKRIDELEKARQDAVEDLRALVASHDDALQNANKQMLRRLNALTDVVDEVRNGTFTMQWEKKEAQDEC